MVGVWDLCDVRCREEGPCIRRLVTLRLNGHHERSAFFHGQLRPMSVFGIAYWSKAGDDEELINRQEVTAVCAGERLDSSAHCIRKSGHRRRPHGAELLGPSFAYVSESHTLPCSFAPLASTCFPDHVVRLRMRLAVAKREGAASTRRHVDDFS